MGKIVFASARASEWLGILPGSNLIEAVSPWHREPFERALTRVREGKTRLATVEVSFGEADRTTGIVEAKLAGAARDAAAVTAVAVWLRDLSNEKSHEAAANVQGTHLLDLVESVSDACVVERGDGSIEMLNAAFGNLFAIKSASQSFVGTQCAALFDDAANASEHASGPGYPPLSDAKAEEREFTLKDGRVVIQRIMPVVDDSGIAGRLHVFRAHKGKRTAESREPAVSAAKMHLIERIAEDLATAVDGTTRALKRTEQLELPEALGDQFRGIAGAANSALVAICDLLDFSRVDGDPMLLDAVEFRLRDQIAAMLERVAHEAERRNVHLRLRIEQDVPEHVIGDRVRLMHCLRCLLECALPNGSEGGELLLTIEPDYSSDEIIHLRFQIEHNCPKGVARGKGFSSAGTMQLALARQIVRALGTQSAGGKIEMRERKDALSFSFTTALPYQKRKDSVIRPIHVTLTGVPVLIVSQDAKERQMLAQNCRNWRLLPREADNAEMALSLLTRATEEGFPIPLVITSNELPIQDGFLLAFRIRHHPALRTTAIMLLAKTGKMGDAIACRENGIHAYLRHPIASVQLNEAISAVIGASDGPESTHTLVTRHSLREAKSGAVLLIDADREQSLLASQVLRRADYRVVVAEFADDAYAALNLDVFDVIIVDNEAPGFTPRTSPATQIKRRLEKISRNATVLLAQDPTKTARIMGFDGSLLKPYDKDKLAATVAKYVQPKKNEPERLA